MSDDSRYRTRKYRENTHDPHGSLGRKFGGGPDAADVLNAGREVLADPWKANDKSWLDAHPWYQG